MRLLARIQDTFRMFPDRPALCIRARKFSYEWLSGRVGTLVRLLDDTGAHDTPVGVCCVDHPDTYATVLACLFAGRPFVPVHPEHAESRNLAVLETVGIRQVLSPVASLRLPVQIVPEAGFEEIRKPRACAGHSPAYVLFTSGSTGRPKGVPITRESLDAFFIAVEREGIDARQEDRFLQMFDLTFDLSLFGYLLPFSVGACVHTVPDDEVKFMAVPRLLEQDALTVALMVPSVLQFLRPYLGDIRLPDLRESLFCGEGLPADICAEWKACVPNARVRNVYGPTEATIFCMAYTLGDRVEKWKSRQGIVSIGHPMHGTSATRGAADELLLSGAQLTPGYLGSPDGGHPAFQELGGRRVYSSGDIVTMDADGDFFYLGRKDQQVKIQGYRVELGEVEFQVNRAAAPLRSVALALPNAQGILEIHVFLEAGAADVERVRDAVRASLSSYMQPTHWHSIPEFPLKLNGKIDRQALAALLRGR